MPNPFDQFDPPADAAQGGTPQQAVGNPFDQFDEPGAAEQTGQEYVGNVLPIRRNADGSVEFDSNAGIIGSIKRTVTLPREVYEGKVDLNTQEGQDRVGEAALTILPTVPSGLIPKGLPAAPKALPVPRIAAQSVDDVGKAASRLSERGAPVNVPIGIASDNKAVQSAFQRGRQVPGATSIIDKSIDDFYKGTIGKVDEVATRAAGGEVKDAASLGASVRASVEKAIEASEAASDDAFKIMRRAIDPDKRVNALTNDVGATINKVMADRAAAGETAISRQLEPALSILSDPKGVSFSGLQRARSQVGRAIKWDEAQGGFNAADLKQVYGALTSAMDDVVRQTAKTSPDGAVKLWKAADARFAKMVDDNKVLGSVLRKDADEGLVSSLVSMASAKSGNARKLSQVLHEIGPDARNEVSGFVIQGLGKGRDGNFSALAFSNNWEKLSPTGKAQLFHNAEVRQALEDLAIITKRMADTQKQYGNSSNTGGAVGLSAYGAWLISEPVSALSALAGANAAARALSKPASAQAAAQYARALEVYVKSPSAATLRMLERAAEKLANRAGAEIGIRIDAAALLQDGQPSARRAVSGPQ